jgi:hypothetical protein
MVKNKKMKICFMGLTGYQLLSGKQTGEVVGPDVYQTLLARELLNHSFQIAYTTTTKAEKKRKSSKA